jgi:asparagine synthase (glutamine-hydrolysing)
MCGIAGFVISGAVQSGLPVLKKMTGILAHRGPDGQGYYTGKTAFLGHRRLSIIDVANGSQPLSNEDGSIWVTYNGEIFNHADLRSVLERGGHRYRTRADTETVVHAYEEYGCDCVRHFRGMFAFAIWNELTGELFCARDRLGIKPFYYFWDGRLFAFASEIKALLQHPAISTELNEANVPEYLAFGYGSDDSTLFKGIRKLMPGCTLLLETRLPPQRLQIRQYWDVPESPEISPRRTDREWIAECRERLEETVRMRLMSDVPLGLFLSGGVDSSAIAALMKRNSNGPVKTFAVGYPKSEFSELGHARCVARALGTDHHEVVIGSDEFFGALPRLIWHEDEPIVWPSSVSLYFVSQLARQHVKVVLTGEGSDELFGGYGRYRFYLENLRAMRVYGLLPSFFRRRVRDVVAMSPLLSASLRRKLGHTILGRGEEIESLYLDNFYCAISQADLGALGASEGSPYAPFLRYWAARENQSPLGRLLYADQKTYLVELLMKQDQMSMATSIESRVPFLDHPLVEFAARVPDRLKIRNGIGKHILKEAVRDLLPPEIIDRKKMGFPTPLSAWFREDKAEPIFSALRARNGLLASLMHLPAVDALIERHRSGFEDATDRIWRLLNFQIWGDTYLLNGGERWEGALIRPDSNQ